MRELYILLKYTFKNRTRKKGLSNFITPVLPLFFMIAFGVPIGFFMFKILSQFNISPPGVLPSGFSLMDGITSITVIMLSFLFFLGYSPMIIYTLFDNENIQFLLSTPVRKINIFLMASYEALSISGVPMWYIAGLPIVYTIILDINPIVPIVSFFLYIILLISISNLVAMLISKFISRTGAKRWGMSVYFLSLLLYFIIYIPSSNTKGASPDVIISKLKHLFSLFLSPLLPSTWLIKGMKGESLSLLYLAIASLLLYFLTYNLSKNLDFSVSGKSSGKRERYYSFTWPFLRKDWISIKREPTNYYLLAFSLLFPLVMYAGSREPITLVMMGVALSGMYVPMLTGNLFLQEKRACPLPLAFPATINQLIPSKSLLPSLFYTIIVLILGIPSMITEPLTIIYIITIPFLLYFVSLFSLFLILKNPERDYSKKNIFQLYEVLLLEFIIVVGALLLFIVGRLYVSTLNGDGIAKLSNFYKSHPFTFHLSGAGIPVISFLFVIYFITYLRKRMIELGRRICD